MRQSCCRVENTSSATQSCKRFWTSFCQIWKVRIGKPELRYDNRINLIWILIYDPPEKLDMKKLRLSWSKNHPIGSLFHETVVIRQKLSKIGFLLKWNKDPIFFQHNSGWIVYDWNEPESNIRWNRRSIHELFFHTARDGFTEMTKPKEKSNEVAVKIDKYFFIKIRKLSYVCRLQMQSWLKHKCVSMDGNR